MKKIIFFLLCSVSLFSFAQNKTSYVAARTGLSIREKPAADSKVLAKIPFGTKVTVLEDTEEKVSIKTEGMLGYWRRVSYSGKTGYIIDSYLFNFPVPKATVKDLKGYLTQLSVPFGSRLTVKYGNMIQIEENGYEIRKQLYKNGAEWHEMLAYEFGSDTYFLPEFNLQQGFLLLRMIPEFKEFFGEKDEYPTTSRKFKKGDIEYEIKVDAEDFGGDIPWINKITISYSDGPSYEFEMFEQNGQLVITLSSGV